MRSILVCLALLASAANAAPVTFDFETLPDSAGCSEPVPAYGSEQDQVGFGLCNFEWYVQSVILGVNMPYIDTEQGLTMDLGGMGNPFPYMGEYVCGNSAYCGNFVASFDKPLDSITVDFAGAGGTDAAFDWIDHPDSTFAYVVIGYSDLARTHEVGRTTVAGLPVRPAPNNMFDLPMSLTLSGVGNFRSVSIAALGIATDGPSSSGGIANLGRIEALHASVPEPGALALLAAGLFALRRRRANPID